jgi:hypothetical protein
MKPLFALLFLTIATACLAQKKQNVYFLKNDGRYVDTKDSADIVRIVSEPDAGTELFNVLEFYKNGRRKFIAKSSTIDPPRFDGVMVSSYEDGSRKAVNNYNHGVLTGDQYEFYKNSKPQIVKKYTGKRNELGFAEFTLTAAYDSLGNTLVSDGSGYYKGYDLFVQKIKAPGRWDPLPEPRLKLFCLRH